MEHPVILPLTANEADTTGHDVDKAWVRGGFPDSLLAASDGKSFARRQRCIGSYPERDAPIFAPRMPTETVGRHWRMLANSQGSLHNQARLASGIEVPATAAGRHIDLLADLIWRVKQSA